MKRIILGLVLVVVMGGIVLGGLYALGVGGIVSGWVSGAVMTLIAVYFAIDPKEKSDIELTKTQRGFAKGKFKDHGGEQCSIQKSSLASVDAIWLGIDDANPQIMSSDAIRMGLKKRTFTEADNGWTPFEIPKEVMLSTRMHLTQKHVKALLPVLKKFAETGDLS